jgi:hypothetical protein
MQRHYGYYANRTRGERPNAEAAAAEPRVDPGLAATDAHLPAGGAVTILDPEGSSRGDARRCWADLIRLAYEVDPLKCPRWGGKMRAIALIQGPGWSTRP